MLATSASPAHSDEKNDVGVLFAIEAAPSVIVGQKTETFSPSAATVGGRFTIRCGALVTRSVAITVGASSDLFPLTACGRGLDTCKSYDVRTYAGVLDLQWYPWRRLWLRAGLGFGLFQISAEKDGAAWFRGAFGVDALRSRHVALTVGVELAELHVLDDQGFGSSNFFTAALVVGFQARSLPPPD